MSSDKLYIFCIKQKKFPKKYTNIKMNSDNLPIRICVNQIENRITFRIKTGYYLELLMPETITLLGSTKSKITKDGNTEIAPYVILSKMIQESCIHLFLINTLVYY